MALHILQFSHGEHRALFRSSLDRFHVTKILLPLSPTQTIIYAQFSGLGLDLSGPLNTQSIYCRNDLHVPSNSWVSKFIDGHYPTKLPIVLFKDNGSFSDPKNF